MKSLLVISFLIILGSASFVAAQEFSVNTSQAVYVYGDYLSFTVNLSEVTKDSAIFQIIDKNAISSNISMAITGKSSTLTAPNPFESYVFMPGNYTLQVIYDGKIISTEFVLMDSGAILIPFWMKDVAELWIDDTIDDAGFLKTLVDNQIITINGTLDEYTEINIPLWYKPVVQLWKNGMITDAEFKDGLEYLISIDAVMVI